MCGASLRMHAEVFIASSTPLNVNEVQLTRPLSGVLTPFSIAGCCGKSADSRLKGSFGAPLNVVGVIVHVIEYGMAGETGWEFGWGLQPN